MKCDLNTVIKIAESQVGYLEKKTNANLDDFTANAGKNNYTKYNREYLKWKAGGAQPMQWCAAFVSWCFVEAYGLDTAKKLLCGNVHCYTPYGAKYFKDKNRYIKRGEGAPKPGDVVFFYSSSKGRIGHVGIVYNVTSSRVYTIEGNTSGASALVTNGGGVCKKSYALTSTYIDGYGRPDYDSTDSVVVKTYKLGDRLLEKGCKGNDVKELQEALIKLGYLAADQADGDFGSITESAVKKFQAANGCIIDGQYGANSHDAMSKALPVTAKNVVTITGNAVNIRRGPGKSYGILKTSRKGDKFDRVDSNDWMCVKHDGAVCWVSEKYINNGVCTASALNVRKGPNTDYKSVGFVQKGHKFTAVDTSEWIPILIDGVIYWVSAKYAK